MQIRTCLFYVFFILFSVSLPAQDFITIHWQKAEKDSLGNLKLPSFEGAVYTDSDSLPHYAEKFDLGWEYYLYHYQVKIEYPEFQELSLQEAVLLKGMENKLLSYPVASTHLGVSSKQGVLGINFVPLVYRDGKFMRINSFKLTLDKFIPKFRAAPDTEDKSKRYTTESVLSTGHWVKIQVDETGVYQISNTELSKMGFSNPSKVRLYGYGGFLLPEGPEVLSLPDDLQEVPLWRENNYVLFYANGTIRWKKGKKEYEHTQNYCSTAGYYFLTESEKEPLAFPQVNSLSVTPEATLTTFPDYALYEKEEYSWYHSGRMLVDNYDYRSNNTQSYTLNTPDIVRGGTITVSFSASANKTTLKVTVNGEQCGSHLVTSGGGEVVAYTNKNTYPWTSIGGGGKSVVQLTHERASTVSGRLDYIRLNYERALKLTGSYINFRDSVSRVRKFVLSGANENTRIWNVSDVSAYSQMVGTLSGNDYSFVTDAPETSEFVAVNVKGTFKRVTVVGTVPNQNLHALRGIDMVIIAPPHSGMVSEAERLAEAHRKKDGMKVTVLTSEQIYNEFSSGTPDVTAYRRFMKMLYDCAANEKEEPKYLLLFGDGAWDNRMLSSAWRKYKPKDFLLCYQSENSVSKTDSYVLDDYYAFLDDKEGASPLTDMPDVGVGRLPVRGIEQAKQMVDKTIDYIYNKNAGAWKSILSFLADDEDNSRRHIEDSEASSKIVQEDHDHFLIKKFYWDAYKRETTASGNSYPDAKKEILEQLKNGTLAISYNGHGNEESLSHEGVLKIGDVQELSSPRLPVWLLMGCDIGPFDNATGSFGEELMLNPKGGGIGVLSPTRTTYGGPGANQDVGKYFLKYALGKKENGQPRRLGDAMKDSRVHMISKGCSNSNRVCYVLLGDPAVALTPSEYSAVVESFNGVAGEETMIKAGGKVTVHGKIVNAAGELAEDFTGLVYPTVNDNLESLVTRDNAGGGKSYYKARTKTLFAGSDSIRGGKFSFTFPVPLDINYSDESGLLNLYAIDNSKEKEALGAFTDFLVGGTEEGAMITDSLGPKIFMYLNTPDFVYGGEVNTTPMLVVELEDEDGINMTGSGIGHDLLAVIDNSPVYTYVLNSYYVPNQGGYTGGTIRYALPELPEGEHKLMFRAWDVKNNSSTSQLAFVVKRGVKPGLFGIECTKSPARTETTFIISHDRPQAEMDVRVSVYDFAGREMWVHSESGVSSDNYYYIDWDLTSNTGQRLSPGVYLFRASVSSEGSKQSTASRKIVILAQ